MMGWSYAYVYSWVKKPNKKIKISERVGQNVLRIVILKATAAEEKPWCVL